MLSLLRVASYCKTKTCNSQPATRYRTPNTKLINFLLYATATLIWGSTWLGIKLQLTQVPPILSVGYRFCLAALILLVLCLITRKRLIFSLRDQYFMAIQGVTLFGLGYCMSYLATSYMTSGLVSVVYTTMLMWNILNQKLFMRQPVAWRAFWGGMLGLSGICIVFWHDLSSLTATKGLIGLGMALLLSTFFEEYHWSLIAGLGVSIVLIGNLIALTPAATWLNLFSRMAMLFATRRI